MSKAFRLGVAVALVAAATTACTSPPPGPVPTASASGPSTPTPVATPTPTAEAGALLWSDGTPVELAEVSLDDAIEAVEGRDFDVLYTTPAKLDGAGIGALALQPDNALLVAVNPSDGYDANTAELTKSSAVGTYDGRAFTPFGRSPSPVKGEGPRQAFAGAAQDGNVVWAETASTNLYESSWRLFARAGDSRTRTLAYAEQVDPIGLPIVDGDVAPVIDDGRVYYATAAPTGTTGIEKGDDGSYEMRVMSVPVGGGKPRLEVKGAAKPATGAGNVYVARTEWDDPSFAVGQMQVEQITAPGKSKVVLTRDAPEVRLVGLETDGTHVVLLEKTATGSVVTVVDTADRLGVQIDFGTPGGVDAQICGDVLTFNNATAEAGVDGSTYVLDLVTSKLWSIPVERLFQGVLCSGTAVAWSTIGSQQRATYQTTVAEWNPQS